MEENRMQTLKNLMTVLYSAKMVKRYNDDKKKDEDKEVSL